MTKKLKDVSFFNLNHFCQVILVNSKKNNYQQIIPLPVQLNRRGSEAHQWAPAVETTAGDLFCKKQNKMAPYSFLGTVQVLGSPVIPNWF